MFGNRNLTLKIIRMLAADGGNTTLRKDVYIKNPQNLYLGRNVLINDFTKINARGRIFIGDDVVFGPSCIIHTNNHRGSKFFGNTTSSQINIGSNVWLAKNVIVTPGVSIGDNVIVTAGSVVTTNIPDNSIAGGNPAKILTELKLPFEPKQ